ncbi:MAG: hypothetical protein RBR45_11645 [Pseudomonas sp.]|jgi:hypothetical protein|nr:hypothetical protein [Pseudomonas sp.]
MQRLIIYAAAALAIAAATWWLIALPRIELAELNHTIATDRVAELERLDDQRVELIQNQQLQILEITENERRNRELLQTIAGQSRAQSRAFEELKRNDETIAEYLRSPVPSDLGRLYQRAATTDPSTYRQQAIVPADVMRSASAKLDTDK